MTLPTQSFMVLRASLWDRWYFLFSYYMDNIKYSQTRKIHCASNKERWKERGLREHYQMVAYGVSDVC